VEVGVESGFQFGEDRGFGSEGLGLECIAAVSWICSAGQWSGVRAEWRWGIEILRMRRLGNAPSRGDLACSCIVEE